MKLVKMSLVAAMLVGASAYAIDNIKVNGDAKLFYGTNDATVANLTSGTAGETSDSLFAKDNSYADAALRLGVTGDLLKSVSFGVTGYAISTLGLENNLVSGTFSGAHGAKAGTGSSTLRAVGGADVNDELWIGEAWLATTMGKTTVKAGRMELDTPLAFSEKWSITPNTFEGAVVINQDIPDTTLVGAWVGKGNGINALSPLNKNNNVSYLTANGLAQDYMGAGGDFVTYGDSGAYALAVINNSFKPLTAQAWYYNVSNVADAYWLQADIDCSLVKGLKIGAQYADIDTKGLLDAADDTSAYAFRLGYEGIENLKVSAAYSDVGNDGVLKIANTATNNLGGAQSKLYTEAWWNYGYVGAPGAESFNLTAEYDAKGIAKFGAYYTNVENQNTGSNHNLDEITLTATRSFGPLDATLAYISTNADDENLNKNADAGSGSQFNAVQAYLTLNF
jgi:hypothetical protein